MSDLINDPTYIKEARSTNVGTRFDRGSDTPQGNEVHEHQFVKVNEAAGKTKEYHQGSDRSPDLLIPE